MHGGGFAGHSGFAGRGFSSRGGFVSHAPMRSGPASFAARQHMGSRFASSSFHGSSHPNGGFNHNHNGFRVRTYWPYSYYRNPYYYGGYWSPFWWDWNSSSYDRSDDSNDNYIAQRQSQQQIDDLSQQVQDLQQEREERAYSQLPVPRPPAPSNTEAKIEPAMSVVLVYLDKHIEEIKNYAVANEKVVVFDNHHLKKIPLADIDLAATMKLNDERGVDFQIPNPAGTE
jgi:hypothetical protein